MSKRIVFTLFLIALLSSCAILQMDGESNPTLLNGFSVEDSALNGLSMEDSSFNVLNGLNIEDSSLNVLSMEDSSLNGLSIEDCSSSFKKEFDVFDFIPTFDSIDLYNDGENVSVSFNTLNPTIDADSLNDEIIEYTFDVMEDPKANVTTLREGIDSICLKHGVKDPDIHIDSVIGEDEIPVIFTTEGDSMLPTIKSGQKVLVNKTHNIQVGDLVSANSSEYGPICKRVGDIDGDSVYLVSDNKEVKYEYHDDYYIEYKGITTWVDIDDIDGEIIKILG